MSDQATAYRLENGRIKWGDWTVADVRYATYRGDKLVRAVNNFDSLLAACKHALRTIQELHGHAAGGVDNLQDSLRAAIAKAEKP